MKNFKVVQGEDDHISGILGNLRNADWNEVYAATGKNPDLELLKAWQDNFKRWALILDDEVVGVFGVAETELKGVGVPWLLGTNKMGEIKIQLVKQCRVYVEEMLERFTMLANFVDARNTDSVKFLKYCGFTLEKAHPYGESNLPFHFFSKTKGSNV